MNHKVVFTLLASLLIASIVLSYNFLSVDAPKAELQGLFVGIDVAYENITQIKALIDKVSPYTNVFVIGCTGITSVTVRNASNRRFISENFTLLNETCQYIYDKGLSFMVFRDMSPRNSTWPEMAKRTWGDQFLGYYAYDEFGGLQVDMQDWRMLVTDAENYSDAARSFVGMEKWYLDRFSRFRNVTQFNLYTSDYAMYWFDYKAGYDAVFAQFGWNYSRQLNIAQCRGAANMFGKDWGAIITWTYTHPPYIESGYDLYEDLVLAYENGAKYLLIFDSNKEYTESVLKDEHIDALRQFWEYAKENPRQITPPNSRVAYVLPKDYGYGFRGPNDKIWGFWEADNLTGRVCSDLSDLLVQYGSKLDIVYDDGLDGNGTSGYSRLVFWNGTSRVS